MEHAGNVSEKDDVSQYMEALRENHRRSEQNNKKRYYLMLEALEKEKSTKKQEFLNGAFKGIAARA